MATVITSKKGSLQWRDVIRGVLMAAMTSALVIVQQSVESGTLNLNWHSIGMAAVGGGVAYILKNWLIEPAKVITTVDSNAKAVKAGETIKDAL